MDGAIEGAAVAGARLIYADSLYIYGPVSGPLTEDLPYAATGKKGKTRAQLAMKLMAAHKAGKVRATLGRASDFYGPGVVESTVGERVFGFALAGKAASVLGDPDTPHTYWLVSLIGVFNPMMRELTEVLYQFEAPFVMEHSKYQAAFGADTTPHREAIRKTLDWYRQKAD